MRRIIVNSVTNQAKLPREAPHFKAGGPAPRDALGKTAVSGKSAGIAASPASRPKRAQS